METNVDALDDDIQIIIVYPPYHGIIRRRSIDRHRFTMADVKDGAVTYEHTGNSSDDDFRFVVRFGAVESTGSVAVHVTNVTSQAPAPNRLSVVTNVVAVVDELGTVQLSPQVLKVKCCFMPRFHLIHVARMQVVSICIHLYRLSPSTCILYRRQNCRHGDMYPLVSGYNLLVRDTCIRVPSTYMYI